MIDAICRTFLPQQSNDDAIGAAETELGLLLRRGNSDAAKLREAVKVNFKHCECNGAFSQLHPSLLSNFLDLCRDPYFAITTLKESCTLFGKDRILKAVSYGGPFEEDAIDVFSNPSLKCLKKVSKYKLLEKFHNVGNNESANWYAELNRETWTDKELIDLVENMGLQPFPIGIEFFRRGMAVQALPYALASKDYKTATKASIDLLESPAAAEMNIVKVLSSWKEGKPEVSSDLLQSPRTLLTLFTKNPKYESCDELTALLINFGPSVTAFLRIYVSRGNCDGSLLSLIRSHHLQLRKRIKSLQHHDKEDVSSKSSKNTGQGSDEKGHPRDSNALAGVDDESGSDTQTQMGKKNTKKKGKNKKKR